MAAEGEGEGEGGGKGGGEGGREGGREGRGDGREVREGLKRASSPAAYMYITCGRMLPPRLRQPATSLPRSHPSWDIHRHTSHCRCHRRRSCHKTRRPSSGGSRGGAARLGHQGRDRPGRGGLGRSAVLAWLGSGAGFGLGLELDSGSGPGSESGSGSGSGSTSGSGQG